VGKVSTVGTATAAHFHFYVFLLDSNALVRLARQRAGNMASASRREMP
jgi:hypothetical protein